MNPLPANGRAVISPEIRAEHVRSFGPPEKLFVIGCVSALAYACTAVFFWTDAVFSQDWKVTAFKVAGAGVPAVLYFCGIPFVKRTPLRLTLFFAVLFALIGTATRPFDSTDAFYYVAGGWHQSHYGQNPYSTLMRDIPNLESDGMISNRWMAMNKNPWQDSPFPYGFGFAMLTRAVASLGAGNWGATLALLNVLNLLVHVLMSVLLWKAAQFVPGADPRLVLYLYAWNPVVLMHSLANGHNDIFMAFGILLAAYFILRGNPQWSVPLLVLAGLIKYGAFVLTPFALLSTFRLQGWKAAVKTSILGGLLGLLATIPYWPREGGFKYQLLFLQATESGGSLHAFATTLFRLAGRVFDPIAPVASEAAHALKFALGFAFLCFVAYQFIEMARNRISAVSIVHIWMMLLFVAICVVSPQFYSWYLVIVVPLAVLHAETFFGRAALVLTVTHVLAFADLRRKSIGYFAICTLLPMAWLCWQSRREMAGQKKGAA